jgi:hypothetical protein
MLEVSRCRHPIDADPIERPERVWAPEHSAESDMTISWLGSLVEGMLKRP